MLLHRFIRKSKGFTLIELLVVITIVGILAGITLVSFGNVQERGRDSRRKQDLDVIQQALVLYYDDFRVYPCTPPLGVEEEVVFWIGSLESSDPPDLPCDLAPTYMPAIPHDVSAPKDGCSSQHSDYSYAVSGDGQNYKLYAQLENQKDSQASGPYNINSCAYNYEVKKS